MKKWLIILPITIIFLCISWWVLEISRSVKSKFDVLDRSLKINKDPMSKSDSLLHVLSADLPLYKKAAAIKDVGRNLKEYVDSLRMDVIGQSSHDSSESVSIYHHFFVKDKGSNARILKDKLERYVNFLNHTDKIPHTFKPIVFTGNSSGIPTKASPELEYKNMPMVYYMASFAQIKNRIDVYEIRALEAIAYSK